MKTLQALGIGEVNSNKLADCPICEEQLVLAVHDLGDGLTAFHCTHCGQYGDTNIGWDDATATEQGYLPVDDTQLMGRVQDIYFKGLEAGLSTGLENLDEYYTVRPGELTVVTGIPNHGKSNVLDQMLLNMVKLHNWKFALFSPENEPHELHIINLLEKIVGLPFAKGHLERMTSEQVNKALAWLSGKFYWIRPKQRNLTSILQAAALLMRKHNINGLVIDPWNRLESSRPSGMSEHEFIGLCLARISDFARKNKIAVWVVAHPTKLNPSKLEGGTMQKQPKPGAYHISGSSNWYAMADNILMIWRDIVEPSNKVELHILKIRFKWIGRVGSIYLDYSFQSGRYTESGLPFQVRKAMYERE